MALELGSHEHDNNIRILYRIRIRGYLNLLKDCELLKKLFSVFRLKLFRQTASSLSLVLGYLV
jgi:hypothetical protein